MTNLTELICIGNIVCAHGIKGEVKIKSYAEQSEDIFNFKKLCNSDASKIFKIIAQKHFKDKIHIATIAGIKTRSQAEALATTKLYVPKSDLPTLTDEEYYQHELVGYKIVTENMEIFGTLKGFHNFGAGDLVEIDLPNNKSEFFTFDKKNFPEINMAEKFMVINLPEYYE